MLRDVRPDVLVLNAGKQPTMAPIDEQTWEGFSSTWNHDVKAGLFWVQAALELPLARGSRVVVSSSGAAVGGSPLSGGYAGSKRMIWLMASYANGVSTDKGLGIRFQTILPMQLIPGTGHGTQGASEAYGGKKGVSSRGDAGEDFGKALSCPARRSAITSSRFSPTRATTAASRSDSRARPGSSRSIERDRRHSSHGRRRSLAR